MNQQDKSMIKKLLGGTQLEAEEDNQELTTSSIPGTTVSFIKCMNKKLNVNIYDTPGIPNPHQIYRYFKSPNNAKIVVAEKKIVSQAITIQKILLFSLEVWVVQTKLKELMLILLYLCLEIYLFAQQSNIKQMKFLLNNIIICLCLFQVLIFLKLFLKDMFQIYHLMKKEKCKYDLEILGLR